MRCRSCTPLPEEIRRAADLLERRWTVSILVASHEGAIRFNEFLQMLGRIPPATLASRLAELESAGVLEREVIDARPPESNTGSRHVGFAFRPLSQRCSSTRAPRRRSYFPSRQSRPR